MLCILMYFTVYICVIYRELYLMRYRAYYCAHVYNQYYSFHFRFKFSVYGFGFQFMFAIYFQFEVEVEVEVFEVK